MTLAIIIAAIVIGAFGALIWLGHNIRKRDRLKFQQEMPTWLLGDIVTINPKSKIWEDILESNPYHSNSPGLVLVRWSPDFMEVQTIRGKSYFVSISNFENNISATERRLVAEMEAFQKTEEEKTILNPDTLYNNVSIYAMKRPQLEAALEDSEESQNYELCEKIKKILEDKYAKQ